MIYNQVRKSLYLHLIVIFLIASVISLSVIYFMLSGSAEGRDSLGFYCSATLFVIAYFSVSSLTNFFILKERVRTNKLKTLFAFFLLPIIALGGLLVFLFNLSFGYNALAFMLACVLPTMLFFGMYFALFFRLKELISDQPNYQ
jgi:hypothetical protein